MAFWDGDREGCRWKRCITTTAWKIAVQLYELQVVKDISHSNDNHLSLRHYLLHSKYPLSHYWTLSHQLQITQLQLNRHVYFREKKAGRLTVVWVLTAGIL